MPDAIARRIIVGARIGRGILWIAALRNQPDITSRHDNLVAGKRTIRTAADGIAGRHCERSILESRMRLVDTSIDDCDLDASSGILHSSQRSPSGGGVDQLRCAIQV